MYLRLILFFTLFNFCFCFRLRCKLTDTNYYDNRNYENGEVNSKITRDDLHSCVVGKYKDGEKQLVTVNDLPMLEKIIFEKNKQEIIPTFTKIPMIKEIIITRKYF